MTEEEFELLETSCREILEASDLKKYPARCPGERLVLAMIAQTKVLGASLPYLKGRSIAVPKPLPTDEMRSGSSIHCLLEELIFIHLGLGCKDDLIPKAMLEGISKLLETLSELFGEASDYELSRNWAGQVVSVLAAIVNKDLDKAIEEFAPCTQDWKFLGHEVYYHEVTAHDNLPLEVLHETEETRSARVAARKAWYEQYWEPDEYWEDHSLPMITFAMVNLPRDTGTEPRAFRYREKWSLDSKERYMVDFAGRVERILEMDPIIRYPSKRLGPNGTEETVTVLDPGSPWVRDERKAFLNALHQYLEKKAQSADTDSTRRLWVEADSLLIVRRGGFLPPVFKEDEAKRFIAACDAAAKQDWIDKRSAVARKRGEDARLAADATSTTDKNRKFYEHPHIEDLMKRCQ